MAPIPPTVQGELVNVTSSDGYVFSAYLTRPKPHDSLTGESSSGLPGILWIHGGGMVMGCEDEDRDRTHSYAEPHPDRFPCGAVVIGPEHRLANKYTGKEVSDDCLATWLWLVAHSQELGVDLARMAIGGCSSGGGLAALTAQRILDHTTRFGGPTPVVQILVYPMLDDRTVPRIEAEIAQGHPQPEYLRTPKSNRYGWTAFLGGAIPGSFVDAHIWSLFQYVPARRKDLRGLPTTWIGVGTMDLFHDECVAYATKLREAGVEVKLLVVEGGQHALDVVREGSQVEKAFNAESTRAVARYVLD